MSRVNAAASLIVMLLAGGHVWGEDPVERGRYLVTTADCVACHTDPAHPELPFGGGRVIQTPFGDMVSPNITPDHDTGIGSWTDAQFDAAVRQGMRADGKRLYPAMPFTYFTRMSAEDVSAMRAYLQTIPPVHHAVEADRLPFPLSIRAVMIVWDALFFSPGPFKPNPAQSPQWNRGAYLVQGPGHCEACHSPKNMLGGDEHDKAFEGYTTQGWFSPDLTQSSIRGLANWSADDIVTYLQSGHNRYAAAAGPMAEEVSFSSSQMSQEDLLAIAQYLKTQHGESTATKPRDSSDPYMVAGAAIYQDLCSACHATDGSGVAYLIPNIAQTGSVASREPTTLLRVLLQGTPTVATQQAPTAPAMPGFGRRLSDVQIAAVATYIRNSWGHAASPVGEADVRQARHKLADALIQGTSQTR
jgi:mono/diheme cytochrome c family protein